MLSPLFKTFLIIFLLGITVYSFSLSNSFIWDDGHLIEDNRYIKNLNTWYSSFTRPLFSQQEERSKFYRPLQEISYALDYRLWGLNPFGFHLTNTFLHIACACLLSLIIYQIFKNPFISFWGGAFFLVHPLHTEAVAYIAGRADSLAAIFLLLSLSCYIQAVKGKRLFLAFSLFSFFLALFSKESSFIFLFVILGYNFIFLKEKPLKKKLFPFLLFLVIAGIYILSRLEFTSVSSIKSFQWSQPWPIRLFTSLKIVVFYLLLLLFPHNLHMERFVPWSTHLLDLPVISSLLLILLIVYLGLKISKKEKALAFFFLFFIITLSPFLNIFPLNAQMAEHWLYLPSMGFFTVLAWGAFKARSRVNLGKNFIPLILTLVLSIYACLTIKQIRTWENPLTFAKYTAEKAPYSGRMQIYLASAYSKKKKYSQAAGLLKTIIKISPRDFKARFNLACALIELGKLNEAQKELETLLNLNPEYTKAYLKLANLYLKQGRKEEAVEMYYKTMQIEPEFIYSYYELGNFYYKGGEVEKAMEVFIKGLAIDAQSPELHNNLGICYAELNRLDEAEAEWKKALTLDRYYQEAKYNLDRLKRKFTEAPDEPSNR